MVNVQSEVPQLGYGVWYGRQLGSWNASGFCVSELEPDTGGNEIPPHSHTEAHLILPLRGKYVSGCVRTASICVSSTVIYHPPGVIHQDHFEAGKGLFFGVSIAKERFASIEAIGLPADATSLQEPTIVGLIHRLREERLLWDSNSALIVEGLVLEVLGRIGRIFKGSTQFEPPWLTFVLEYLLDNLSREITLASLSKVAQVSELELAREFRRFMQCSPGSYLRKKRMEHARHLLLTTKWSLVDVALALGFSDQSAFHKTFRRTEGCTPGAYRRAYTGR
jgi:AraC family transcriptional regulator